MRSHGPSCEKPKCPLSLMSPLVIGRGFVCNIFVCRRSTTCAFICQCHWGSSSTPSLWILSCTLDENIAQAPLHFVIVIFSILFSSRCSCLFFMEYLLYTQQNIYQNIVLLKSLWNYLSNEWSFALNGVQTRELWPFYFSAACCLENFRVHDFWCFGHNFLWETSIDFILDSLEPELQGAF